MSVDRAPMAMSLEQVSAAIFTALNPSSAGKAKSLEMDKVLKENPSTWSLLLLVMDNFEVQDQILFYCLSLLEGYSHTTVSFRPDFMTTVLGWISQGRGAKMAGFIKNKIAQVISRCIISEYTSTWPTVFLEMCEWCLMSADHADLFLRTCLAISEELSSDIMDDKKENPSITQVKDKMREGDVGQLVQKWRLLITDHSQTALLRLSLKCISGFAPWIDVNLTANPELLQHIYACLEIPEFRSIAIDCITAVVGKGMPIGEKLKLIVYLNLQSVFYGAIRMMEDDDEFFEKSCRLLNVTGLSLLSTYDSSVHNFMMQSLVPILCQYLRSNESVECLLSLAGFSCAIPEYFKGKNLDEAAKLVLLELFKTIINILRYPKEFDFDSPGEVEELFPEVRQKYMSAFDQLLHICGSSGNQYVLEKMAVASNPSLDSKDRELGLYLCFRYCDAHRGYSFAYSSTSDERKLTPLGQIMFNALSSQFSAPFVFLTYLNCMCRISQTPFFEMFPNVSQTCLQSTIAGFSFKDEEVAKKSYSAFNKMVKAQKPSALFDELIQCTTNIVSSFQEPAELFQAKLEFYEAIGFCFGHRRNLSLHIFEAAFTHSSSLAAKCNVIRAAGAFLKGFLEAREKNFADTGEIIRFNVLCTGFLSKDPSEESIEACKYFCQRTIGILRASGFPLLAGLILCAIQSNDEATLSSILQLLSAAIFKLKSEIIPLLSPIWAELGNKILALSNNIVEPSVNHPVIELRRQTMAMLISIFFSNSAAQLFSISVEPYLSVAVGALNEPDYALKRSALSVFTRFITLPDCPQINAVLTFIVKNVFPMSIACLKAIPSESVHEANHQSFLTEFCNFVIPLCKFSPEVCAIMGQLGINLTATSDPKALKSLLLQMLYSPH